MIFIKLFKSLIVLSMVLTQWGVVVLNLNRWGIFQKFIEIEFLEEPPKKESTGMHERNDYGFPNLSE